MGKEPSPPYGNASDKAGHLDPVLDDPMFHCLNQLIWNPKHLLHPGKQVAALLVVCSESIEISVKV